MSDGSPTRRRCPVDVFKYQDYREFLGAYYEAKKPAGFSYRGFSRAAGLGAPNYLKLVIDGQRNLTPAMAKRFAGACGLEGDAAEYFEVLVHFNQAKNAREREEAYARLAGFRRYRRAHRLDVAHAAYHSSWYVPAIRELVASEAFREDPEWIAAALRPSIKPSQARHALSILWKLDMLERGEDGRLRQRNAVVSTGAEAHGVHIVRYHKEMMQRAAASMEEFAAVERDISSLTLCVGPEILHEVKRRLVALRKELLNLAETETEPAQVIQFNLQLFPLTRDVSKGDPQ